jgi:hypothetical protein
MTIQFALAVFGVIATLIFGGWSLALALRYRYPGQITFVSEQIIGLFDEIVKNLPELAVLYKGTPVTPNVILIRGAFVNTGKRDIAPAMIERPITLRLPEDCRWLSSSAVSATPDIQATIHQTSNSILTLSTSLLRCKEFIRFQALAEVPPVPPGSMSMPKDSSETRLETALEFDHRIQDTQPIRRTEVGETSHLRKRLRVYLAIPILGLAFMMAFAFVAVYEDSTKRFAYELDNGLGNSIIVKAWPTRSGQVSVTRLDQNTKSKMPLEAFLAKCHKMSVVDDRRSLVWPIVFTLAIYVLIPLAHAGYRLHEYRTTKRLRRTLGWEDANERSKRRGDDPQKSSRS